MKGLVSTSDGALLRLRYHHEPKEVQNQVVARWCTLCEGELGERRNYFVFESGAWFGTRCDDCAVFEQETLL